MAREYVTYKGRRYYVKNGKLELRLKKISDITEIKGLENLTNLERLILDHNKITEIKGLENLIALRELDLRFNPIRYDEKHLVDTGLRNPQVIVRYCQEKARRGTAIYYTQDPQYIERIKKYIIDMTRIYTRLRFEDLARNCKVSVEFIQVLCEDLLHSNRLEGHIDHVAKEFIKMTPKYVPQTTPEPASTTNKFCLQCGASISGYLEFCHECGYSL